MKGYTACPDCPRQIVDALFEAHQRRHAGTDWFSERRPVRRPRPGMGSRARDNREGEGAGQRTWARPRPNAPHTIEGKGRPS